MTTPRTLLATLALVVAAMLIPTGPATAREADWANFADAPAVCVQDTTGRTGDLSAAVRRWNAAGAHLYVRRDCTWTNDRYQVEVKPYTRRGTRQVGLYDTLRWYPEEDRASLGQVRLNTYQPTHRKACVRRWAMAHELGHALGLDHRGGDSVMNAYQWRRCGVVTTTDRRDLAAIR